MEYCQWSIKCKLFRKWNYNTEVLKAICDYNNVCSLVRSDVTVAVAPAT